MPPPQEVLFEILSTILAEVTAVAPRIFFALLALAALAAVGKLVHALLSRALEFAKVDEGLARLMGAPPISPSRAIIAAADLGIVAIGVLLVLNILVPEEFRSTLLEGLVERQREGGTTVILATNDRREMEWGSQRVELAG